MADIEPITEVFSNSSGLNPQATERLACGSESMIKTFLFNLVRHTARFWVIVDLLTPPL